ncbi:uncharacterized protein [Hyperolius riggenbachi]|uniref:uncharacterized protein n=1 Tax=Hyperolius riggenbachi TaxID=752182 RepID=UPI0035A26294
MYGEMSLLLAVAATLLCAFLVAQVFSQQAAGKDSRYPVPGRWYYLKKIFYYLLIQLTPRNKPTYAVLREKERRGDRTGPLTTADLEKPQTLIPGEEQAIDSVYFTGVSENDKSFIITRVARRPKKQSEVWVLLRLEGVGDFQHSAHPDTILDSDAEDGWNAGGLKLECLDPFKTWRISFAGVLRKAPFQSQDSKAEAVQVTFSLLWTAESGVCDFDYDLSAIATAHAMALEEMSINFFKGLRSRKESSRYEQWGSHDADLVIGGQEKKMRLFGVHTHSYGARNWADFHRYAMILMHFETGECAHLDLISIPTFLKHYTIGYVLFPDGSKSAIDSSDAHLSTIAEDKDFKNHYVFNFTAGGKQYSVCASLDAKTSPLIHNSKPSVAETYECPATFTLAPGHKGWGIVELYYKNKD